MKIAFCAFGVTWDVVSRTEFYRQDFEILKSLGHEVVFVSSPAGFPRGIQLSFVWWWNYLWAWWPVAALRGLPILTTGVFDVDAFQELSFPKRLLKRWGARRSDLNVVVSRDEEQRLPALLGAKHGPIRYSPLAIDSSVYAPTTGTERTAEPFTILNVAWQRIPNMRRKMVPELLEAFALLAKERSDTRLILAGPPEDGGPILRGRAHELGVEARVDFPGEISRERKIELLQSCSVYCQVSRYEGFGVAIAEAMACGAPVLVAASGAVPEVVGECGTYVRERSVAGILDGLRKCLSDREEVREKARGGARRIRETFSVERRRQDLKGFIQELTC